MSYDVLRRPSFPIDIAAIRDRVTLPELPRRIRHAVDATLGSLRASGTGFGRCVALYWDHDGETPLLMSRDGCEVEVGWEIDRPYTDHEAGIVTARTPEGTVAWAEHVGPYEGLPEAHRAVRRWCVENGVRRLGPNWEVYDHPREGEPPRTEVCYLVE